MRARAINILALLLLPVTKKFSLYCALKVSINEYQHQLGLAK